jgi:hypothetical protein
MGEEQQVSTGMTVTLFTLQSIYAQNEDETMEFLLEANRMNLRVWLIYLDLDIFVGIWFNIS